MPSGAGRAEPTIAGTTDPSGIWRWEHREGNRTVKNVLKVKYDGEVVEGTYQGKDKEYLLQEAKINGNSLSFEFPVGLPRRANHHRLYGQD